MAVDQTPGHNSDHYAVLGLCDYRDGQPLASHLVKAAYKKALLTFHPDKINTLQAGNAGTTRYSVDDVALAYKILSDAKLRAQYDVALRQSGANGGPPEENFRHTGLETVDLDDLIYDEDETIWTRDCRCGSKTGFMLSEPELVENADDGEIIVGCRGCSLWLRVLFSAEE